MIFALCDEINSGKSSYVLKLSDELLSCGILVSGFITPAHLEHGKKTGHDFILIDGGCMGERTAFTRQIPFDGAFLWRHFYFNSKAFKAANALDARCDLFIMDEIGPLEINDEKGFHNIMMSAISASPCLAVIRASMRNHIKNLFGDDALIFDLKTTDHLLSAIQAHYPSPVTRCASKRP